MKLSEAERDVKEMQEKLASSLMAFKDLQNQSDRYSRERLLAMQAQKDKVVQLEAELTAAVKGRAQISNTVQEIKSRANDAGSDVKQMESQLASSMRLVQELKDKASSLEARAKASEEEKERMGQRLVRLMDEAEELKAGKQAAEEELREHYRMEAEGLAAEVEELKERASQLGAGLLWDEEDASAKAATSSRSRKVSAARSSAETDSVAAIDGAPTKRRVAKKRSAKAADEA
jgi:chromosome segregation ATPase